MFSALDSHDTHRLLLAVRRAEGAAAAGVTRLLSGIGPSARISLRRKCRFAHRAVLLFPTGLDHAIADFADQGLDVAAPIPSVLVRRRLCARYGLTHEACDVSVTRFRTPSTGVEVEVFLFPRISPALEQGIIDAERTFGFEDHLAVEVHTPDERTLERLMTILQRDTGLVFEGGGHNPRGDFSTLVERHPVDHNAVDRVYSDWVGADPRHLPSTARKPTLKSAKRRPDADHGEAEGGCAPA